MGWTIIAVAFVIWLTLVILFTPRIDYRVTAPTRPDSEDFLHVIQMTCQASVFGGNRVDVLTNGLGGLIGALAAPLFAPTRGLGIRLARLR